MPLQQVQHAQQAQHRQQAHLTAACLIVLGLALIAAPPGAAPAAEAAGNPARDAASATAPRRLGYVVGDVIDRQVVISAAAGSVLEQSSLPRLGEQNFWLALTSARVRAERSTPTRYEIDLRYQLINAPTEVRSIALPAFQVRFTSSSGPRKNIEVAIGGQPVSIAPILPAHVPVSAALVRPDRSPRALSSTPERAVALVSTMLALAIVAALISLPILRRRNAPFARACRVLRNAVLQAERKGAAPERVYPCALRAVHRAFDQTAGWRLFPERVGEFLAQWRQFSELLGGIERFLELSQREFFEPHPREPQEPHEPHEHAQRKSPELRWLLEFAHECRARERHRS